MKELFQKKRDDIGLAPGTLIHVGEKKTEEVTFQVFNYDQNHFQEMKTKAVEDVLSFKNSSSITWINVNGLHQIDILERFGAAFGLHSLILEDILNTTQRPKIEDYEDYLYIVVKMIYLPETHEEMMTEQISIILGKGYVLSFQEEEGDVFEEIRDCIRNNKGLIRKMGADYLAYTLLDVIVDNYFLVIENIGEMLEDVEDELVEHPSPKIIQSIHTLKREMIYFRGSIWPLREVIGSMERRESPLIQKITTLYLRDVYDHTIQLIETIETDRDLISSILDIYLSSVNNRLNEVMKVLTMIATVFMPLSFIAGVYGMNFRFMPELNWRWGYPVTALVMGGVAAVMVWFFKNKKWL